jgi:hypothetical protein
MFRLYLIFVAFNQFGIPVGITSEYVTAGFSTETLCLAQGGKIKSDLETRYISTAAQVPAVSSSVEVAPSPVPTGSVAVATNQFVGSVQVDYSCVKY